MEPSRLVASNFQSKATEGNTQGLRRSRAVATTMVESEQDVLTLDLLHGLSREYLRHEKPLLSGIARSRKEKNG